MRVSQDTFISKVMKHNIDVFMMGECTISFEEWQKAERSNSMEINTFRKSEAFLAIAYFRWFGDRLSMVHY